MKPTIHDVARQSGLSIVTVSRVINNVSSVREQNRQKVMKAMRELNYHPNAAARMLAKGKTGTVGLLIPTLYDSFMADVVKAVELSLKRHDYFTAIAISAHEEGEWIGRDNFLFQEERVDGFLILSPHLDNEDKIILELKKKRIPFVLMDNQHHPSSAPTIMMDNFIGGYKATQHLIELGHKRIAHISGTASYLSTWERERGYRKALEDSQIDYVQVGRGSFDINSGYEITNEWIKSGDIPTAIFAADDQVAFGVMDALRENGLKVPQDISIVGYDDHPFANMLHPHLTTIRQPAEEMGEKGVELLIKQFKGELKKNVTHILKPKLIIRDSTTLPSA